MNVEKVLDEKIVLEKLSLSDIDELKRLLRSQSIDCSDIVYMNNYFIIDKDNTNFGVSSIKIGGYRKHKIIDLPLEKYRPNLCKVFLTKQSLDRKSSKKRRKQKEPMNWESLPEEFYEYFHKGHILGYSLGNELVKGIYNKNKRLLFVQTAWSNMNSFNRNPYSQYYFEKLIEDEIRNDLNIFYESKLIYKSDNDIFPIGINIQVKSSNEGFQMNVFLPNIDPKLTINYQNGEISNSC